MERVAGQQTMPTCNVVMTMRARHRAASDTCFWAAQVATLQRSIWTGYDAASNACRVCACSATGTSRLIERNCARNMPLLLT